MASKDTGPDFSTDTKADTKTPSEDDLAKRVKDLETRLAAAQAAAPLTLIPEHGAGPGMEVNETWSQADQVAANANQDAGVGPDPT
jgi:hypothetical protein